MPTISRIQSYDTHDPNRIFPQSWSKLCVKLPVDKTQTTVVPGMNVWRNNGEPVWPNDGFLI